LDSYSTQQIPNKLTGIKKDTRDSKGETTALCDTPSFFTGIKKDTREKRGGADNRLLASV
jgi:hypothetical protein